MSALSLLQGSCAGVVRAWVQIPTVELLLAPLRDCPANGLADKCAGEGLTVLSLCDGIGGAAVALHNLGIRVAKYILVEKDYKRRQISENFLETHFTATHGTGEATT